MSNWCRGAGARDRRRRRSRPRDHVVLPGLINTHHHFYQTLTRAVPAALDRELFPWLKALYPIWAKLTPEALDAAVTVAMAELMLSGCTTTTDHHYVFPAGLEDGIDIEIAAAQAARHPHAADARLDEPVASATAGCRPTAWCRTRTRSSPTANGWSTAIISAATTAMTQIALAPCSPFSVTTSLMKSTAALADKLDVRLHTHLAETEDENTFCEQLYGCRPLDYLEDCGWLNSRTWLAHGIHFSADEMPRLGQRRRQRSAIAPAATRRSAPAAVRSAIWKRPASSIGLGVDGSASNDESNLMQEVRAAFLLQRARYGVLKVSHKDALRWATKGSAACVGRPELGEIAVGKRADLALFKLDELRFSGHGDPLAALVLCGAHRADRVMVEWPLDGS